MSTDPQNRRITDRVGHAGQRGVSDPSSLTTQSLLREISLLRTLMESRMEGMTAIENEKFTRVAQQFTLVEQQRVEQKSDTKAAVDAALTAQKEAVKEQTIASERSIAKSEMSTSKQLEQLNTTFATAITGLTTVLNDLKDRVGKLESVKQGSQQAFAGLYALGGLLLTAIIVALAVYAATR